MECRRNASVISNYGLEIRDKKYDHHYQPTDCRMGAGFRRSDGCNRNHRSFDASSLHCHCNQWRQLQAGRTQAKKNDLPNNLQAAKELKPEWHNCRRQGLSVRGSTYLTVDNDVLFYMFMVYIARENLLASFIFMQGGLGHVISVVRGIGRHIF